MKKLTIEDRLQYARATASVLRALAITDRTARYKQLAIAIGLMGSEDPWQVWHKTQITEILNLTAAAEHQGSSAEPLEFERIVGQDGEPGAGFHKTSRIVQT